MFKSVRFSNIVPLDQPFFPLHLAVIRIKVWTSLRNFWRSNQFFLYFLRLNLYLFRIESSEWTFFLDLAMIWIKIREFRQLWQGPGERRSSFKNTRPRSTVFALLLHHGSGSARSRAPWRGARRGQRTRVGKSGFINHFPSLSSPFWRSPLLPFLFCLSFFAPPRALLSLNTFPCFPSLWGCCNYYQGRRSCSGAVTIHAVAWHALRYIDCYVI